MTVTKTASRYPHALRVVARYHGLEVEDTFASRGTPLVIGNTRALAVPTPNGFPYIARCTWTGPYQVAVVDGRGREACVEPDVPTTIHVGPVQLVFTLVPQYHLARAGDSRWWESMPWLGMVLAASLLVGQGGLLHQNRCEWLGGIHGQLDAVLQCRPPEESGSGIADDSIAEFLERLIMEDYAGEEVGILAERKEHEVEEGDPEWAYMPAGQDNDVSEMGGAEDVGPEEVRTPEADEPQIAEAAPPEPTQEPLAAETDAPPTPEVPEVEEMETDGVAEVEPSDELGAEEDIVPPEEDKEGWGVQDWYDQADRAREQREIELMTEYANQRLRIDPNDPTALSILSYYQYLDEDFEAALATYDKYIAQLPEEGSGYNNKALVYKRQGDYVTEERLYRLALAFSPNDVTTLNNLAVCLAHQGRIAEAKQIMDQLETLDPGDPYAELHRAKIYAESGENELVYRHLRLALEGMAELDTLHHIEFRQDIRVDPSFESMRRDPTFRSILIEYYGKDSPLQ